MSAQTNSELARQLYETFNKGDLDGCVALATDDVEVVISAMGQSFHGKDGFREFMGGLSTAFPDMVITVINQVATEDERRQPFVLSQSVRRRMSPTPRSYSIKNKEEKQMPRLVRQVGINGPPRKTRGDPS